MRMKNVVWSSVVAASLLAASTAVASPKQPDQRCVWEEYSALSVAPYNAEEDFGLGTYTRLSGAQIFVSAKPGLTAEWLALRVQRALAENEACRPNVQGVQVQVASAGNGFWVVMKAPNEQAAAALLKWAHSIAPAQR